MTLKHATLMAALLDSSGASCSRSPIANPIDVARLGRRAAVLKPKKISMSDTVAVMTGAMTPDQIPAECLAH